jgi:uncharacterized protein
MKAAIAGGTGFIGKQVVDHLAAMGYDIVLIGRSDITGETSLLKAKLKNISVVVNLAGAPIINRWTDDYKKEIYNSRIKTTTNLVYAMDTVSTQLFISASAVGIYSNKGEHTESNYNYANDYLATVCKDWEAETNILSEKVRTVIFRFGVVLGKGGALQKMLPLFRLGLGGIIASGKQPYSWVHIKDVLGAISFVMEHSECKGIYNLTAPHPVTNHIFTKALAKTLKRAAFIAVPAFILKMIYGEGASVLIGGQSAYPQHLLEDGYKFQFPEVEGALENIIHHKKGN